MRRRASLITFGAALAALAAMACNRSQGELREWQPEDHQPPPSGGPSEGQGEAASEGDTREKAVAALWSMRCGSCHGEEGLGNGPKRPPGVQMPDLSSPAFHEARTDQRIAEVIRNGQGMMPAFGEEITDAGIQVLVEHVRGLKKQ